MNLKIFGSFFHLRSPICNLRSLRSYSLSQQWFLLFLTLLLFGFLTLKFYDRSILRPSAGSSREFVVEVSGEVDHPGVHLFQNPPTLHDVMDRAGEGREVPLFHEGALADVLRSGTLLTVAREPDGNVRIQLGRMEARKLLVFSLPLDLNGASREDLCLIPGVGEWLAQEIVTYRMKRKKFRSLEELRQVKGIGETHWKALQAYLAVL